MPSIIERLLELALAERDVKDLDIMDIEEFEYRLEHGYERFRLRVRGSGLYDYSGAFHPNGHCEGGVVCKYCGRTLAFD